ncbi:hypothetical protein D3C85_1519520 [compost metagenome]
MTVFTPTRLLEAVTLQGVPRTVVVNTRVVVPDTVIPVGVPIAALRPVTIVVAVADTPEVYR